MSDLHHECGLAAIYHLPCRDGTPPSHLCPAQGPEEVSRLVPRMLLDIQNRGQLSAGMTVWNPDRSQLLATIKDVGSVTEVFRLSHRGKYESLMAQHTGRSVEEIARDSERDKFLTATEAVEYRLVDKVLDKRV